MGDTTVVLCEPDGTLLLVSTQLDAEGDIPLATLQALVGGWVSCVHIANGLDVWVNDEGRNVGMPTNMLSRRLYPGGLAGPMVFATTDEHGGTGSCGKAEVADVLAGAMWCPTHTVEQVAESRERGWYWAPGEPV